MSEWAETTLADVMTRRTDFTAVNPDDEYVILGVQRSGWGFVHREPSRGRDQKFTKLMKVEKNDLVYRTITAFEAPSAVAGPAESGHFVTPQTFPVFRLDQEAVLPGYMQLLTTWPSFHHEMATRCTGTVLRRKTLAIGAFTDIPVSLPPLDEQRRIIRVMAAVDDSVEALRHELERSLVALDLSVSRTLSTMPDTRLLGDFTSTRSGPSYTASDVSDEPSDDSTPTIGIPNTKPDGSIDLNRVGHVTGLPASVAKISASSLVLIRTNGNRQRIGNVYLPPARANGHVVSAFQFLMQVQDPADREFTYWVLREPSMQRAMSEAASGTTGLGNLAVKWLNSARVFWSSDPGVRAQVVTVLRGQQEVVDGLRSELDRLRMFRSTLLASLLSQDIEIPESYDDVLERTA